jgi:hypothetical protein
MLIGVDILSCGLSTIGTDLLQLGDNVRSHALSPLIPILLGGISLLV